MHGLLVDRHVMQGTRLAQLSRLLLRSGFALVHENIGDSRKPTRVGQQKAVSKRVLCCVSFRIAFGFPDEHPSVLV